MCWEREGVRGGENCQYEKTASRSGTTRFFGVAAEGAEKRIPLFHLIYPSESVWVRPIRIRGIEACGA